MTGSVTLRARDGIGTIEFHHPKGNSLPGDLLKELESSFKKAGENQEIRVIVLKSRGNEVFCAGASFDELVAIDNRESGKEFFMGFARVLQAMIHCPKLIIARVEGKAVGGGVGIIAASDYALALDNASVKLSELTLGIGPFVIAPVLEKKMGASALASLTVNSCEWHNAEWSLDKGLFHKVFDSEFNLDSAVSELSHQLSEYSPEAMAGVKNMLWRGMEQTAEQMEKSAALNGELVLSNYTRNFIRQFKAR